MPDQSMVVNLLVSTETGGILYVSSGATDFYGYTMEQLKTMHIFDITQHSARELSDKIGFSECLQTIPLEIRHASGDILPTRAYASFIATSQPKALFLCIFNPEPEAAALCTPEPLQSHEA